MPTQIENIDAKKLSEKHSIELYIKMFHEFLEVMANRMASSFSDKYYFSRCESDYRGARAESDCTADMTEIYEEEKRLLQVVAVRETDCMNSCV